MSTKIYNGYRMKKISFDDLNNLCIHIQNKIFEKAKSIASKDIALNCSFFLDSFLCDFYDSIPAEFANVEYNILQLAKRTCLEIEEKSPRMYCSVCFFSYKRHIYCTLYSSISEFTDIFQNSEGIEYYGYWNNTDRPEELTKAQWKKRGKEWDEILSKNKLFDSIPGKNGLVFDFIDKNIIHEVFSYYEFNKESAERTKNIILSSIPSFEERVKTVSIEMAFKYFIKNVLPENKEIEYEVFLQRYYKFREYLNTDDGKKKMEEYSSFVSSRIPQTITEDHLNTIILLTKKENDNGEKNQNEGQASL